MDALETRYCDGCVRVLPVERFRPRSKDGGRMQRCNDCHAEAERHRRAGLQSRKTRRQLRQHFAAIADDRNRNRTQLLTAVMLDDFGGLPGFITAWQDYLADARQRGGLAMFRALQVTLRLIDHENAQRKKPSEMTDDELEAALSRFLRDHPEFAADPSLVGNGR